MSGVVAGLVTKAKAAGGPSLPALANLVGAWFSSDYQTSPVQYIPNRVYLSGASSQSVAGPRDKALLPASTVIAIGGQSDPYGGTAASRISATSAFYYSRSGVYLPAGTYTVSIRMKSNIPSPPQVNFLFGSASTTWTITQSWATYTYTFTVASPTTSNLYWMYNSSTVTADFAFIEPNLYVGASPGTHVDASAYGHLYFDNPLGGGLAPAGVSGGVLDFSNGNLGRIDFPAAQTVTAGTFIALCQETSTADYGGVFTDIDNNYGFVLGERNGGGSTGIGLSGGGTGPLAITIGRSLNYVAQGFTYDSTGGLVFLDSTIVGEPAALSSYTGFKSFTVNAYNNSAGHYKIASMALWNKRLSLSEYAQAVAYMKADATANGLTLGSIPKAIISEGDSITAGGYSVLAATNGLYSPVVWGVNAAVSGSTIADLVTRAAADDQYISARGGSASTILSTLIGTNDLLALGNSTWLTNYAAYLDARKAANPNLKRLVCTITPNTGTGFNTARNAVNPTLRSWIGTHCEAIADFAADATMGPDAAASNSSLYSDGKHPTAAGNGYLASVYATAVNAL